MDDKGWSYAVTHRVPATFPPYGLYTKDAGTIYKVMRRPEVSPRGLPSAIQMVQFYINRAGKGLPEERKNELRQAISHLQTELKYHNVLAKGGSTDGLEQAWRELNEKIDLSEDPEPYRGPASQGKIDPVLLAVKLRNREEGHKMQNKYLEKIAGKMDTVKAGAGKFARAFKGVDMKDAKEALKRTPVNKENLAARVDLTKKFKAARNQTLGARGAAGVAGIATGAAATRSFKQD